MLTIDPAKLPSGRMLPSRLPADLAVVIPTYNEAQNIPLLIERLDRVLIGHAWEVVFVDDDSQDGTAEIVQRLARTQAHVRCIQRIGRKGLSSAVTEGILSVNAPYVAVMDADLQHDETILLTMLRLLEARDTDLVVGSRYMEGGSVGEWSPLRHAVSRFATRLSEVVIRSRLSDPMSGFFMVRRECFLRAAHELSGNGYKILLDLLASSPEPLRVAEVPYVFRARIHGESKLDSSVMVEHGILLLKKAFGRRFPVQGMLFGGVLAGAITLHLGLLSGAMRWLDFTEAQATASLTGMAFTAMLSMTFLRDRAAPAPGWLQLIVLLATCTFGLAGNLSLAGMVYGATETWWLAGAAGVTLSTAWLYMSRVAERARRR